MTTTQFTIPACEYANDGARITSPGKFEGEPVFAPHLWDLALQGFSDADDGRVYSFRFTADEKRSNPILGKWLGRKQTVRLWEDSQGFVRCF